MREVIRSSSTTRYRMAKDLGVSQAQLSRFMAGDRALSVELLERLADYLNLEIVIRPRRPRKKG